MDPFADPDLIASLTDVVTSAWESNNVITARSSVGGEVLGYTVTDSLGLFEPHDTFLQALVDHATTAEKFGGVAAEVAARNFWFREALLLKIAADCS